MNPQLNATSSWFQIQQVLNPNVIILQEATGGDTLSTDGGSLDITWDDEDRKNSAFTHGAGSSDVKVAFDGLYKVSYGVKHSTASALRTGTGAAIQIQPDGGSFTNSSNGWSFAYLRTTTGGQEAAMSASTILNLTAQDTVKVVLVDTDQSPGSTRDVDGGAMHFDMEYLGTDNVQALILHDNAGGDDLDLGAGASTTQFWDTADGVDSDFTFTPVSDSITINTDGLYHIGYTTWVERNLIDDRFEYT